MRGFQMMSAGSWGALRSLATITAMVTPSCAFVSSATRGLFAPTLRGGMSSQIRMMANGPKVPIQITGNNIELTQALKDYVTNKLGNALSKVGRRVIKCDVHFIYDKNPSISTPAHAEVTLFAKGATIRATKCTHDMYASIDEVADLVRNKLVQYKERIITKHRKGALEPALDEFEMEEFSYDLDNIPPPPPTIPPVDLSVVKKKKFPMDPITVEDAVLCLDYIQHDFYVFKNSATGKINVVYKRNHGGVGLIEPE